MQARLLGYPEKTSGVGRSQGSVLENSRQAVAEASFPRYLPRKQFKPCLVNTVIVDIRFRPRLVKLGFAFTYSHGYLYGSASVAMVGPPPYSPDVQAAARAGTLLPKDYTGLNHSFAEGAGAVISTAKGIAEGTPGCCRGART